MTKRYAVMIHTPQSPPFVATTYPTLEQAQESAYEAAEQHAANSTVAKTNDITETSGNEFAISGLEFDSRDSWYAEIFEVTPHE